MGGNYESAREYSSAPKAGYRSADNEDDGGGSQSADQGTDLEDANGDKEGPFDGQYAVEFAIGKLEGSGDEEISARCQQAY